MLDVIWTFQTSVNYQSSRESNTVKDVNKFKMQASFKAKLIE